MPGNRTYRITWPFKNSCAEHVLEQHKKVKLLNTPETRRGGFTNSELVTKKLP